MIYYTVEFLGIWEQLNNPKFNCVEFDIIKSQAGLNSYRLSVKEWMEKTKAIGIISKAGRYGGTYAHKDIAFEFAMWISPEFKVYLIREFQRLKSEEQKQLGWSAKRELSLPFPILLQIEFAPWLINTWTNDFSEASVVCNYIAIEILSLLSSSPAFAS